MDCYSCLSPSIVSDLFLPFPSSLQFFSFGSQLEPEIACVFREGLEVLAILVALRPSLLGVLQSKPWWKDFVLDSLTRMKTRSSGRGESSVCWGSGVLSADVTTTHHTLCPAPSVVTPQNAPNGCWGSDLCAISSVQPGPPSAALSSEAVDSSAGACCLKPLFHLQRVLQAAGQTAQPCHQ